MSRGLHSRAYLKVHLDFKKIGIAFRTPMTILAHGVVHELSLELSRGQSASTGRVIQWQYLVRNELLKLRAMLLLELGVQMCHEQL